MLAFLHSCTWVPNDKWPTCFYCPTSFKRKSIEASTPQPLYNRVHYNTILDIKQVIAGPQKVVKDLFCYITIHFTLFITWIG